MKPTMTLKLKAWDTIPSLRTTTSPSTAAKNGDARVPDPKCAACVSRPRNGDPTLPEQKAQNVHACI